VNRHIGRLKRIFMVVYARFQLRGCDIGFNVGTYGGVDARPLGRISIGDRVSIMGGLVPTRFIAHPGAELRIGPSCMLNSGSTYEAHGSIIIGRECLIASSVLITDKDGEGSGPIVLEDNVWLAHGAVVRPGVRIGKNSAVSAGTVVVGDVPPDSLVVGNPGRAVPLSLVASKG
jgi:maltose O-acetyltransferase